MEDLHEHVKRWQICWVLKWTAGILICARPNAVYRHDTALDPVLDSYLSGERVHNESLTHDEVGSQARFLLTEFIVNRMKADGFDHKAVVNKLVEPDSPLSPPAAQRERIHNIAEALKTIADDLDKDRSLHKLIEKVSLKNPEETFSEVAHEIFSDGVYNWGRVVTLFYFAYKMIVRAIQKQIDVIRCIVQFVIRFITEHVAAWIIDRGGWGAVYEYFGATGYQVAVVLGAGIIMSVFVYWKCTRS